MKALAASAAGALALPAGADNPVAGVWRIVGDKSGEAEAPVKIAEAR